MRYRPLLKTSQWSELVGIPFDEEGLIRHFTLSGEDIDRVLARRGENNQLGFAVQLCLMRYPGRTLGPSETLQSAMLGFVAQQLDLNPDVFGDYARRTKPGAIMPKRFSIILDCIPLSGMTGVPPSLPLQRLRMQPMMEC